jgi:hypothetical protein
MQSLMYLCTDGPQYCTDLSLRPEWYTYGPLVASNGAGWDLASSTQHLVQSVDPITFTALYQLFMPSLINNSASFNEEDYIGACNSSQTMRDGNHCDPMSSHGTLETYLEPSRSLHPKHWCFRPATVISVFVLMHERLTVVVAGHQIGEIRLIHTRCHSLVVGP